MLVNNDHVIDSQYFFFFYYSIYLYLYIIKYNRKYNIVRESHGEE